MTDIDRGAPDSKPVPGVNAEAPRRAQDRAVKAARTDVVIAEDRDGWTLSISPRLLKALTQRDMASCEQRVTITVRPNLVPGEPFVAELRV